MSSNHCSVIQKSLYNPESEPSISEKGAKLPAKYQRRINKLENDFAKMNGQFEEIFFRLDQLQEKLNTIKQIHKFLENRDEIGKVQSIHTLMEVANQLNQAPLTIFELEVLFFLQKYQNFHKLVPQIQYFQQIFYLFF